MNEAAVTGALERRYRGLLRAYPPAWRATNGEVLLAVLMDGAEARGTSGPSGREWLDLLVHGFAERARAALPEATRNLVASAALGAGLGFTLAYFVFYSWVRPDFYSGTAVAGPLWFLPAWLLLVATATRNLAVRVTAVGIVTAVAVLVPVTRTGPFPVLRGFWPTGGPEPLPFHFVLGGIQALPANAANVTLVIFLALLSVTGRPRLRGVAASSAAVAITFGLAFAGAVFIPRWPGFMSDDSIWTWQTIRPQSDRLVGPFVGAAQGAVIVALSVAAVATHRRRPAAAALLAIGALCLTAAVVAMNLAPRVGIGL